MHEDHHNHIQPLESPIEYAKFAAVIIAILVASLVLASWRDWSVMGFMAQFMGVFFITFGAFKLAGLQMFVITYRGYDILAKRFKFWAWAFPFIEIALGLSYLAIGNNLWLNIITIFVTGLAGIGVAKELRRKSDFKCACLGSVIRLPLSKVSLVENLAMFGMAVYMIIF